MSRLLGTALLFAAATVGLSCGDSISSMPGELKVRLTTPNPGADSAIVFTITAPPGAVLTRATAGAGLQVFHQPLTGSITRFAVLGRLTQSAVILTIGVPDVSEVSQYEWTIDDVAQPDYQLRALLDGYALAITR